MGYLLNYSNVNEKNNSYMYFYSIIGERNQDGILLKLTSKIAE
jgi:hypothetical protein